MFNSTAGYPWQMDGRSQDEGMLGSDAAGQHRDAQGKHFLIFLMVEEKIWKKSEN